MVNFQVFGVLSDSDRFYIFVKKKMDMETLIVTLKDKHELQLVSDMLKNCRKKSVRISDLPN